MILTLFLCSASWGEKFEEEVIDEGEKGEEYLRTLIIDPGHGGTDKGKKGKDGLVEKDIVMEIALYLKQMAVSKLGLNIIMTREGDYDISIEKRITIANNGRGTLFISLHAGNEMSGIVIYHLGHEEIKEESGNETGNGENAEGEVDVILKDMTRSNFANEGAEIAELIRKNLMEIIPDQEVVLKSMPVLILKEVNMPSVMVEVGNITNPEDVKKLKDRKYIDKLTTAILNSIKESHEVNPVRKTLPF